LRDDEDDDEDEEEDEDEEGFAAHVARKTAGRAYVKRHQSWRSDHINHHAAATAAAAETDKWESTDDDDVDNNNNHDRNNNVDNRNHRSAGDHRRSSSDEDDEEEEDDEDSPEARGKGITGEKRKQLHGGEYPAAAGGNFVLGGGALHAKDERDKEWAALTTWIRMNLHQPRTVGGCTAIESSLPRA
jgi:hypothetical protein